MDSGWAVVLGAAIAFIGTIAGGILSPLVVGRFEDKREQARHDRDLAIKLAADRSDMIAELCEAATDVALLTTSPTSSTEATFKGMRRMVQAENALFRLTRTADDDAVSMLVAEACAFAIKGGTVANGAAQTLAIFLPRWVAGRDSAADLLVAFRKRAAVDFTIDPPTRTSADST